VTILQRYTLRELLTPLGMGILVFTFVFLIGQIFKLAELVLNSGVPGLMVGELILLLLPGILSLTIPMAVLVAILMGIGRLAADREILAIRASGVNLFHISVPVIGLAVVLSGLMMWANQKAIPYLNQKSVDMKMQLEFHLFSALPPALPFPFKSSGAGPEMVLFYDHKDPITGVMKQIAMTAEVPSIPDGDGTSSLAILGGTVQEKPANLAAVKDQGEKLISQQKQQTKNGPSNKAKKNAAPDKVKKTRKQRDEMEIQEYENRAVNKATIFADQARIIPDIANRVLKFELTSGSIHLTSAGRPNAYDFLQFNVFEKGIVPTLEENKDGTYVKSVSEMSVDELRLAQKKAVKSGNKYMVEYYQRFSIPLACIAFALIALPLAVFVRPTGKAIAFGISFFLILTYYGLLQYGIALCGTGSRLGPVAIFFPNLLLAAIGSVLLYRMVMK
jgi:lipopolysaccharide export LptBFGC system permease protein LptF